jgi:hypothetical protein
VWSGWGKLAVDGLKAGPGFDTLKGLANGAALCGFNNTRMRSTAVTTLMSFDEGPFEDRSMVPAYGSAAWVQLR